MKKAFFSLSLILLPVLLLAGFIKEYDETGGDLSIKNHPQPFISYEISTETNQA